MIYIITGGPATGKGTRSNILSKALNIPHISTGDILRKVSKTNQEIADALSRGELISNDIITKLLADRIDCNDCSKGFILDGYPRTVEQIELLSNELSKRNLKIDKVIELVVSDDLAAKRILERKACENCGTMYGIDFPSKIQNVCDKCSGKLVVRTDDTRETLQRRIDTYRKNSQVILKYYKEKGLLKTVDASVHPENIIEDVK